MLLSCLSDQDKLRMLTLRVQTIQNLSGERGSEGAQALGRRGSNDRSPV